MNRAAVGQRLRRHSTLTSFSQRMTPAEVAQHWFRRGADFASQIHAEHPDFPKTGPDGLYLLTEVETWFDRWHGRRQGSQLAAHDAEARALEVARHGRGSH